MPIDIKVNQIEVRNPRSNEYIPIDLVTTTPLQEIQQAGENAKTLISTYNNNQKSNLLNLIARRWSSTQNYNIGDYVFYPPSVENIYKCNNNGTFGDWKVTQWTLSSMSAAEADGKTPTYWSDNVIYNSGDYVIYVSEDIVNVKLYKCKEDNITGAWNSSKWKEIIVSDYLVEKAVRMTGITAVNPTISDGDLRGPNSQAGANYNPAGEYARENSKLTDYIEIPSGQTIMIYWSKLTSTSGLRIHIFFQDTWIGRKSIDISSTSEPYILPINNITNVKDVTNQTINPPINATNETVKLRISWNTTLDGLSFFLVPNTQKNDIATAFSAAFTKLTNLSEDVGNWNNAESISDVLNNLNTKVGTWTEESSISNVVNELTTDMGNWTNNTSIADIVNNVSNAVQTKNVTDIVEIYPKISIGDLSSIDGEILTSSNQRMTNFIDLSQGETLLISWKEYINNPELRIHVFLKPTNESDWVWQGRIGKAPSNIDKNFFIFPKINTVTVEKIVDDNLVDVEPSINCSGEVRLVVSWDVNTPSYTTGSTPTIQYGNMLKDLSFFVIPDTWQENDISTELSIITKKNDNLNTTFDNSFFGMQQALGITEVHPVITEGNIDNSGDFYSTSTCRTTDFIDVPEGKTLAVYWKQCINTPGLRFNIYTFNNANDDESENDNWDWTKRASKEPWNFDQNYFVYQKGDVFTFDNYSTPIDVGHLKFRVSWDYSVADKTNNTIDTLDGLSFFIVPDYYFLKKYKGNPIITHLEDSYETFKQLIGVTEIQPVITDGRFNNERKTIADFSRALTGFIEVPAYGTVLMRWNKKNSDPGLQVAHYSSKSATADSVASILNENLNNGIYTYTSATNATTYLRLSWIRDSLEGVLFSNGSNEINNLNTQMTSLNNRVAVLETREKSGAISIEQIYTITTDNENHRTITSKNQTLKDLGIVTETGIYRITLVMQVNGHIATSGSASEYIFRYYTPQNSSSMDFYRFLDIKEGDNYVAPRLTTNSQEGVNDGGVLQLNDPSNSSNTVTINNSMLIRYFLIKIS